MSGSADVMFVVMLFQAEFGYDAHSYMEKEAYFLSLVFCCYFSSE